MSGRVRHAPILGWALAALCLAAAGGEEARAQGGARRVRVRVTAVSPDGVFLDAGREAGLEAGDPLQLFPPSGRQVPGTIRVVSRTSARAEVAGDPGDVPPGTEGEVWIPEARFAEDAPPTPAAPPATPAPSRAAPEHPPWERPLDALGPDEPLLAPMRGRAADERPITLRGRAWSQTTYTWDRGDSERSYLLTSLGTDLRLSNPFGAAGEVRLRGDVSYREAHLDDAPDDRRFRGRLDRLSYRYGHATSAPLRFQLGRFLQTLIPELGVIDGGEVDVAVGDHRFGVSVGFLPEPLVDQTTGDDLQVAVAWRYTPVWLPASEIGAGYQKTWHEGEADRDLLFLDLRLSPIDDLFLYGSVWVDIYTAADEIKPSGVEVTQLLFTGTYRFRPQNGLTLAVSYVRWPELLREEFLPLPEDLIRDSRVLRLSASTWHGLTDHLRLTATGVYWRDQDEDGLSGDVGLRLFGWPLERVSLSVNVFHNGTAQGDGDGLRAAIDWFTGSVFLLARYEVARYEGDDVRLLQAVGAELRWGLHATTDLSLHADYRFGDSQRPLTLGAFLQVRF